MSLRSGMLGKLLAFGSVILLACGDDEPTVSAGFIELSISPSAVNAVRGGTAVTLTVTLARGGSFIGPVTLAVSGLPNGVSGTITPAQLSGNTVTAFLAITADQTAALATTTATVTASGEGVSQASVSYQVTVTAPPAGGAIEFLFCPGDELPVFVAYQNGNDPWQAITGSTSGTETRFVASITQPTGGVLFIYQAPLEVIAGSSPVTIPRARRFGARRFRTPRVMSSQASLRGGLTQVDGFLTDLFLASSAELRQVSGETCEATEDEKTVTGTVVNVPANAYGIVSLGDVTAIFNGGAPNNPLTFTISGGPVDLVGGRAVPGSAPDRVVIMRGLNIPPGGTVPAPIDFTGPASSPTVTATATLTGGSGHDLEVFVTLVTANGQDGGFYSDLAPSPNASRPWGGFGPAALMSGEFHGLIAFASLPGGTGDFRVTGKYVGAVANENLAFGPVLAAPTVTQISAGAYPRFRFQGTLTPDYNKGLFLEIAPADVPGNSLLFVVTSAWLAAAGSSQSYDLALPDVSQLAGFPGGSRLPAGDNRVILDAFGFSGPGIFELTPVVGGEFRISLRSAVFPVP